MEVSPNQFTEPMAERERRLFANIEFVLADYDRYTRGEKPDAVSVGHPEFETDQLLNPNHDQ